MKGRNVPPFRPAAPANASLEELIAALSSGAGLFMLEYRHDNGCPTIRTQRWQDCTCSQVDHELLRYDESEAE